MGVGGFILALSLAAPALAGPSMLTPRPAPVVAGQQVRLGDVIDLSSIPPGLRDLASPLVVARFRDGQTQLKTSTREVAARARAQLPALSIWLADGLDAPVLVRRTGDAQPRPPARRPVVSRDCLVVTQAVPAGAYPLSSDFSPAVCDQTARRGAFSYDAQTKTVRAKRDLEPGEHIEAVPTSAFATVRAGQPLFLEAHVGPVLIQRQVQALRPAGPGRAVLVQAMDGAVFSAPMADIRP